MIKKTWLFEKSGRHKRLQWWWTWLAKLLIGVLLVFALTKVIGALNPEGYKIFINNITKLFQFNNTDPNFPSYTLTNLATKMLVVTINYTILGTTLGFVLGFIISFFSSHNFTHPIISYIFKGFFLFLRAFPVLIVVYAFQTGFIKDTAVTLILGWITMLWTNKYISEIFENSDQKLYHKLIKQGNFKISAFYKGIILKNKNKILMVYLYALESNLRWAAILGTLGIVGIGELIASNIPNHFENIGIPLLFLLLVIILLELLLFVFNNYLLNYKGKKIDKKNINLKTLSRLNWQKIFQNLFLLAILIWNIYLIATFKWNFSNFNLTFNFIKQGFGADLSTWNSSSISINPWLMLIDLGWQVLATMTLSIILSLFLAILNAEKTSNKFIALFFKTFNALIRIFPAFVLLFIFDPLFLDSRTTSFVILTISQTATLTKQFSESINNLSQKELDQFRFQGYSWVKINCRYVFPKIKKDIVAYSLFGFENLIRTYIFYGVFNGNLIGSQISSLYGRNYYQQMFDYVWAIVITLIIVNIVLKLVVERDQWKLLKNNIFHHQYLTN